MVLRPAPYLSKEYFRASLIGALVCLRAGVAEEHALHPRAFTEGRQRRRRFGVEEVGDVRQFLCLRGDGAKPLFVPAAKGADLDAAGKVDIRFAVKILERRVFALLQRNGKAFVSAKDVRVGALDDVFVRHGIFLLLTLSGESPFRP